MIQEESEHQKKFDEHHRQIKSNKKEGSSSGDDNFEARMNEKLNDMEKILNSFEESSSHHHHHHDKKKKKDPKSLLKKKVGLGSSLGSSLGSALETLVVGALIPLDSLEEKSRETDSYSTPHASANAASRRQEGAETNATLHPLMRPPSTMTALRQYVSPDSSFDKSDDGSSTRSGGTSTTANSSSHSASNNNPPQVSTVPPTYEELQRRYLQINTRRRDEFSIRVIDALLDAWPRGPKTASEGGRLPLHMACFGIRMSHRCYFGPIPMVPWDGIGGNVPPLRRRWGWPEKMVGSIKCHWFGP